MLQVAICDDDPCFLNALETLLESTFQELLQAFSITAFSGGRTLVDAVEKQNRLFDIIFLDVDMPQVNGFSTAQVLRRLNMPFILIFVTNLESHVREGYKYNAFRYVFKNNLQTEVREAVSVLLSKWRIQAEDEEIIQFKHRNTGAFETLDVKKSDILYFRLEKTRRVTLITHYSEYTLLVKPLSEYQKELNNDCFCLFARNYLINFNRVADITDEYFIMEDGERIPLGFSKATRRTSKAKYLKYAEGRI